MPRRDTTVPEIPNDLKADLDRADEQRPHDHGELAEHVVEPEVLARLALGTGARRRTGTGTGCPPGQSPRQRPGGRTRAFPG